MAQRFTIQGSAAAITGAASGIGRALALEFAARGCDVAMADLDEAGMENLAAEISKTYSRRVIHRRVDVADVKQVEEFAQTAIAEFPNLNIVINNAGVAMLGEFDEYDHAQMQWLMGINFWGVVYGTRAFLAHLKLQPAAHIVNMSSIFGVIAPVGQSAYSASKFAVRGFSEAVRHELATKKSSVRLCVVHPGGVSTNIARHAQAGVAVREKLSAQEIGDRFEAMARTTPAAAAQRIIRGIERNEPRVLIGADARLLEIVQRLRPASYWSALSRVYNSLSGGNP